MVLKDREDDMPQVEGLTQELEGLWLDTDLRRDTRDGFEKHAGERVLLGINRAWLSLLVRLL